MTNQQLLCGGISNYPIFFVENLLLFDRPVSVSPITFLFLTSLCRVWLLPLIWRWYSHNLRRNLVKFQLLTYELNINLFYVSLGNRKGTYWSVISCNTSVFSPLLIKTTCPHSTGYLPQYQQVNGPNTQQYLSYLSSNIYLILTC